MRSFIVPKTRKSGVNGSDTIKSELPNQKGQHDVEVFNFYNVKPLALRGYTSLFYKIK